MRVPGRVIILLLWGAACLALVCSHARAGGYVRHILLYGQQFPDTLVVLVDNSGSMKGDPYACAIRQAMWVADQAGDGARVRFATFGKALVWQQREWTKLPDAEALALARVWLQARGTKGNTGLAEAVEEVLRLAESPLGVVVSPTASRTLARSRRGSGYRQRTASARSLPWSG